MFICISSINMEQKIADAQILINNGPTNRGLSACDIIKFGHEK